MTANHGAMDEGPFAHEIQIGAVSLAIGASLVFRYDFGDDWKFQVLLEEVGPADPKLAGPKVIARGGKAPRQYPAE